MKRLSFFGILLIVFALWGCAGIRTDAHEKDLNHQNRTNIIGYGAEHAKIIGPVFFDETGPCSRISFYRHVVEQNSKVDDIIDIKMEALRTNFVDRCSYSGLAVSYESLSAEEAMAWRASADTIAIFPKDKEKEIIEKRGLGASIWAGIASVAATVFLILFIASD